MEPVVVMLSGGINGAVGAARVLDGAKLHFLYVDHGHAAAVAERAAVARLTEALAATLHIVELPFIGGSEDFSTPNARPPLSTTTKADTHTARRTPGLILTMVGLAQQLALRIGAERIVCGASQICNEMDLGCEPGRGERGGRHVFFHAAQVAMELALPPRCSLELHLPFIDVPRADIIRLGQRLGAPLHLTWSCHRSAESPCAKCSGCTGRAASFGEVGVDDPALAAAR